MLRTLLKISPSTRRKANPESLDKLGTGKPSTGATQSLSLSKGRSPEGEHCTNTRAMFGLPRLVHDPDDEGADRGVAGVEDLAGAVAFIQHEYDVADAGIHAPSIRSIRARSDRRTDDRSCRYCSSAHAAS